MNARQINWSLWIGLLLTLIGGFSYIAVFIWFPITRDFPWANLLIFGVAVVFLWLGLRRGFARERAHPKRSKVITSLVTLFSVAIIALFLFSYFVFARWLPASTGAPQVGQKVPEFTLPDSTGKQVSLNELLTAPIDGKAPKGVLIIFYRGYW